MKKAAAYPPSVLAGSRSQRTFTGKELLQIAMPLGGIGAGCICLNGYGGLQDFSIRNRPATTAVEIGNAAGDAAFALLHLPGSAGSSSSTTDGNGNGITRLVEGPLPVEKIYDQGIKSQGNLGGGHEGLPRFRNCTFKGEYPFGYVTLSDPHLPIAVKITGFNPFIPLDDINSGIPCAILEYTLENTSDKPVEYEFSYHLSHLASGASPNPAPTSRNAAIPGVGVYLYNEEAPGSAHFGSAALGVIGHAAVIKAMWFRGGWFDSISALWREVSTGTFHPNDGQNDGSRAGRNGGSILMKGNLPPHESVTYPVVIAWHFPNVYTMAGGVQTGGSGVYSGPSVREAQGSSPAWRPYYVTQWKDAREVLLYVREQYEKLRARTLAFHDALFDSTLPSYVLDAVSANLAILKSPTVLRQESGSAWGWEGCFPEKGCCPGSCTHVWNYAQAMPHLFPQLERTLREQELLRSMDEQGHVTFRAALPDGKTHHSFHAAADGQLGGIMKVYREWQISGDGDWLHRIYPAVKRSMDYCIKAWDPKMKGVIEEPHHNTYDIEFWGPDGMCTSFYLGALAAMAAMAIETGHEREAGFYGRLAMNGMAYLDENLFNGEYFEQKVTVDGLRDKSFAKQVAGVTDSSPEEEKLLKAEGPKYQYGSGCLSDGVLGAWMANRCGVASPQNRENIRRNLKSIFEYNFKDTLWDFANCQRPGYAVGDEPGLVLCTWPKGNKPTLPFVYSDEVWTGIEYQVASHLIEEGMVDEGLTLVAAVRSRYDGHVRNPWNEYECGGYYARAMSSYALLETLSGFSYSAVTKTLNVCPKIEGIHYKAFFSTATGYGTIAITGNKLIINMVEGQLVINRLHAAVRGKKADLEPKVTAEPGKRAVFTLV